MHFITATVIFGMISTAIAAPQPEAKGNHGAVGEAGGFFPGSTNSACYCCPSSGEGTSCGRVDEQGRCRNGDVLICCDLREQVSINLVASYSLYIKLTSIYRHVAILQLWQSLMEAQGFWISEAF